MRKFAQSGHPAYQNDGTQATWSLAAAWEREIEQISYICHFGHTRAHCGPQPSKL
jgi:hypothetical protein